MTVLEEEPDDVILIEQTLLSHTCESCTTKRGREADAQPAALTASKKPGVPRPVEMSRKHVDDIFTCG